MIFYVIIIIVILFGAIPFGIIETLINTLIDSINTIMVVLTGIVNGLIQLILGVVFGLINLVIGGLYNVLAAWLPLDPWVNLVPQSVVWEFFIPHVSFASAGFNVALSPIGTFVNTLVSDPFYANLIGGIAFGTLAVLIMFIAWKSRK